MSQNKNKDNKEDKHKFGRDIKILILGNMATGKTSIINRYINDTFEKGGQSTIAPNFSNKIIQKNGVIFRLLFWDIPGQDRNSALTNIFCQDSQGILFCCEVKNEKSRNDILVWKSSLENFIDLKHMPAIILENKCDLLGEKNDYEKDIDSLKNFCEQNELLGAFRTSALNGYNIEKAIEFLVNEIIKNLKDEDIKVDTSFNLDKSKINEDDKAKKCC